MSKKFKKPKISEEEVAELTQAVQFAFGDPAADEFFEQVMTEARRVRKVLQREEQTRTE